MHTLLLKNLRAWWHLLRAGNLPTAVSNVLVGYLLIYSEWPLLNIQSTVPLLGLILVSTLFYESGMVLNDLFDTDKDFRERPERPIPSGHITRRAAAWMGWSLWTGGLITVSGLSVAYGSFRPMIVGVLLAGSIIAYDIILKQTYLAPWAMGCCRMLNVLLGASIYQPNSSPPSGFELSGFELSEFELSGRLLPGQYSINEVELFWSGFPREVWLVALAVGLYTVGLTWFARTEAATSHRSQLALAGIVAVTGMLLLAALPMTRLIQCPWLVWTAIWTALIAVAAIMVTTVVVFPSPCYVQAGVQLLILGFIVLDATVCLGIGGPTKAILILTLLIPTLMAKHFTPMT